jgi:predicted nuclease of predicted toxin-antitoxin system
MLRLLADENIHAPLVSAWRDEGVDVRYIAESSSGITDREVLQLAIDEHRVLVTEDKDFGDLVFRLQRGVPGVVLIRLSGSSWQERHRRFNDLRQWTSDRLVGRYVVLAADRIRSRPMP